MTRWVTGYDVAAGCWAVYELAGELLPDGSFEADHHDGSVVRYPPGDHFEMKAPAVDLAARSNVRADRGRNDTLDHLEAARARVPVHERSS